MVFLKGHLAMSRHFYLSQMGGAMAASAYRPGMLLNILQDIGLQQRIIWPKMSIVLRLSNPDLGKWIKWIKKWMHMLKYLLGHNVSCKLYLAIRNWKLFIFFWFWPLTSFLHISHSSFCGWEAFFQQRWLCSNDTTTKLKTREKSRRSFLQRRTSLPATSTKGILLKQPLWTDQSAKMRRGANLKFKTWFVPDTF